MPLNRRKGYFDQHKSCFDRHKSCCDRHESFCDQHKRHFDQHTKAASISIKTGTPGGAASLGIAATCRPINILRLITVEAAFLPVKAHLMAVEAADMPVEAMDHLEHNPTVFEMIHSFDGHISCFDCY